MRSMTTLTTTLIPLGAAGRLLAAVILALAPAVASACMPAPHDGASPVFERGERGAMLWLYGEARESRLSPADDLGGGFVVQTARSGNGCSGEVSTIVQNCSTGEAVAFGGNFSPEDSAQWSRQSTLLDEVRSRIGQGRALSVADIIAAADAQSLEFAVPMRTTSRLLLGEKEVELRGGCRAFYPRLPGSGG